MSRSRLQESNRRWFAVMGKVETLNLFGGGELTIEEQKATVKGSWCAQSLKEPLIFGSQKPTGPGPYPTPCLRWLESETNNTCGKGSRSLLPTLPTQATSCAS